MGSRRHRVNINEPRQAHELTFSCYRRFPFLQAERTCRWLADSLDRARQELNFAVWAWVFMPDHAHVIVYIREDTYDIGKIRRSIKGPVGRKAIAWLSENPPEWLPRITRQRGRRTERLFWQSGRGYDRNVVTKVTLLSMIDYLHENPARKELGARLELVERRVVR